MSNVEPLLAEFRSLPKKLGSKALKSALRKGATVVKKDAQKRAKRFDDPATAAKVWKEITVRAGKRRRNGDVTMQVGVKGGAKRYVDNARNRRLQRVGSSYEGPGAVYYWRFLEFGTSKMKAQPFMRPALANNVEKVMDAVTVSLRKGIDKAVAK